MAFNEVLNDRIREALMHLPDLEEKYMFGVCCYMVNGKMCVGVVGDELMCRIGAAVYEEALERPGCREMRFTGRSMKGYVFVSDDELKTRTQLDYWVNLCISFNAEAKAAKKKVRKEK